MAAKPQAACTSIQATFSSRAHSTSLGAGRRLASLDELQQAERTKGKEWKEDVCRRMEGCLRLREDQLRRLEKDFCFNLRLLGERDRQFQACERHVKEMRMMLEAKEVETSRVKRKLSELEKEAEAIRQRELSTAAMYQRRLQAAQAELADLKRKFSEEHTSERRHQEAQMDELQAAAEVRTRAVENHWRMLTSQKEVKHQKKREEAAGLNVKCRDLEKKLAFVEGDYAKLQLRLSDFENEIAMLKKSLQIVSDSRETAIKSLEEEQKRRKTAEQTWADHGSKMKQELMKLMSQDKPTVLVSEVSHLQQRLAAAEKLNIDLRQGLQHQEKRHQNEIRMMESKHEAKIQVVLEDMRLLEEESRKLEAVLLKKQLKGRVDTNQMGPDAKQGQDSEKANQQGLRAKQDEERESRLESRLQTMEALLQDLHQSKNKETDLDPQETAREIQDLEKTAEELGHMILTQLTSKGALPSDPNSVLKLFEYLNRTFHDNRRSELAAIRNLQTQVKQLKMTVTEYKATPPEEVIVKGVSAPMVPRPCRPVIKIVAQPKRHRQSAQGSDPEKMYALNKAPRKIVAKTRRGLPQKFESLETFRDLTRKKSDNEEVEMSSPKPIFHSTVNGRKLNSQHSQQEIITPQHEELIKYVYGSWNKVVKEYEQVQQELDNGQGRSRNPSVVYYDERPHSIEGFQPFDLEAWWGKRLFQNLTQST